jgi:hypothetical protein
MVTLPPTIRTNEQVGRLRIVDAELVEKCRECGSGANSAANNYQMICIDYFR